MTGSEFPSLSAWGEIVEVMSSKLRAASCGGGGWHAPGRVEEYVDVVALLLGRTDTPWQGAGRGIGDGVLQPCHDLLADSAVGTVEERLDRVLDHGQSDLPLQLVQHPKPLHQAL